MLEIYVLYQGDKLIARGSLKSLADLTGLFSGSLLNYSYPKYLEKNKQKDVLKIYKISDHYA